MGLHLSIATVPQVEAEAGHPDQGICAGNRATMTPSERALAAAKARELYDRQAKERQKESGKHHGRGKEQVMENLPQPNPGASRDQVGKVFGVSGKTVDYATKILKKDDDLRRTT